MTGARRNARSSLRTARTRRMIIGELYIECGAVFLNVQFASGRLSLALALIRPEDTCLLELHRAQYSYSTLERKRYADNRFFLFSLPNIL